MDYSQILPRAKEILYIREVPLYKYGYDFDKVKFTNWYMFASVVKNEEIAKGISELIWGAELSHISEISSEKTIITDGQSRDVRLDLLVVDNNLGYFVTEMENSKRNLVKRSDYYDGAITVYSLKRKEDYDRLKNVHIAFICTKDPFNKGQAVYTVKKNFTNANIEEEFNTVTKFINVTAYENEKNKELREFMAYVDHEELSDNKLVKMIDSQVNKLKKETTWRNEYMKFEEILEIRGEEKKEEGIEIGLAQMLISILKNKFKLENFNWLIDLNTEQLNEIGKLVGESKNDNTLKEQINSYKIEYRY